MLNVSGLFTEYVSDKGVVVQAAKDVSFEVPKGKLFTLLGPCLLYTSDAADE